MMGGISRYEKERHEFGPEIFSPEPDLSAVARRARKRVPDPCSSVCIRGSLLPATLVLAMRAAWTGCDSRSACTEAQRNPYRD